MNLAAAFRERLIGALLFTGLGGRFEELPNPADEPRRSGTGKSAREYARWKNRNRMARASRRANRT